MNGSPTLTGQVSFVPFCCVTCHRQSTHRDHFSVVCLSVCLSVRPSVRLSVCLFVTLFRSRFTFSQELLKLFV